MHLGPDHVAIYSFNLTLMIPSIQFKFSAFIFFGKAFQILRPNVARLLFPKVADLRVFTKMSLGLKAFVSKSGRFTGLY